MSKLRRIQKLYRQDGLAGVISGMDRYAFYRKEKLKKKILRRRDRHKSTYASDSEVPEGNLSCRLEDVIKIPNQHHDWIRDVAEYNTSRKFNILGSGWTEYGYESSARGIEGIRYDNEEHPDVDPAGDWLETRINRSNIKKSKQIWKNTDDSYAPIDWHRDIISGHRWSKDTWYEDVRYGHKRGVDIKVLWELARMHHLPHLAWAFSLSVQETEGFRRPHHYKNAFHDQICDFVSTNPPRYGVNWASIMGVAIRATNICVAYDIFHANGASFEEEFEYLLKKTLWEHCRHIVSNLEWRGRGDNHNHYLSNISGLIVICAYFPSCEKINRILLFSLNELVKEVREQFYQDGSNFEGSVCYHRLSTEMIIYATAIALGISEERWQEISSADISNLSVEPPTDTVISISENGNSEHAPFPDWYVQRVYQAGMFSGALLNDGGRVPQIADNDSGRFLKLFPAYTRLNMDEAQKAFHDLPNSYSSRSGEDTHWEEDFLNHSHILSALSGIYKSVAEKKPETEFVNELSGDATITEHNESFIEDDQMGSKKKLIKLWEQGEELSPEFRQEHIITDSDSSINTDEVHQKMFPEFGIYIFNNASFQLVIRCGPANRNSRRDGHLHNDELSVTLSIDGEQKICDPGTFVYTPLPKLRNKYRSVSAHFAPQIESYESCLGDDVFELGSYPSSECYYFGSEGFAGSYKMNDNKVYRLIKINHEIKILDFIVGNRRLKRKYLKKEQKRWWPNNLLYSPSYGVRLEDEHQLK